MSGFSHHITELTNLSGARLAEEASLAAVTIAAASAIGLIPYGTPLTKTGPRGTAVALLARYPMRLAGAWRRIYVVSAAIALYLNVFVAVTQAFMKVPALTALAPTQSEPPFAVAQLVVLALFIALTLVAVKKARG